MTHSPTRLKEIRERLDTVGSWRSDDFGHDCHALLEAESRALSEIIDTAERLIKALELAVYKMKCLATIAYDNNRFQSIIDRDKADIEKILIGEK